MLTIGFYRFEPNSNDVAAAVAVTATSVFLLRTKAGHVVSAVLVDGSDMTSSIQPTCHPSATDQWHGVEIKNPFGVVVYRTEHKQPASKTAENEHDEQINNPPPAVVSAAARVLGVPTEQLLSDMIANPGLGVGVITPLRKPKTPNKSKS